MLVDSTNGIASTRSRSWFNSWYSIVVVAKRARTNIRSFNAISTFPRRIFESELRPGVPSAISYRRPWKKLSASKNYTGSLGPDRETVSHDLRRARLEQKGRRHRRSRSCRNLEL